ncbi:hypothetical protein IWW34DRAFT_856284 [Fusarium oxysporum f. sp. albedinis]|nr:hypothetical protein IWW34DRAFT_856284 [Fusarium oxysporum f. sp. albedinis]KAK2470253.1 hypothetical protein H9L39_17870 [Fusarium oxysporum f. sp. albedinis]
MDSAGLATCCNSLATPATSTTGTSAHVFLRDEEARSKLGRNARVTLWTCCVCGHSGMSVNIAACQNCASPRCAYCLVERVKTRPIDIWDLGTIDTSTPIEAILPPRRPVFSTSYQRPLLFEIPPSATILLHDFVHLQLCYRALQRRVLREI